MSALHTWSTPEKYSSPSILKEKYKLLYEAYGNRRSRHLGFLLPDETFWECMKRSNIPFSKYDLSKVKTHYDVDGQQFWKNNVKAWMERIDNV